MGQAEGPSRLLATAGFLGVAVAAIGIMQMLPTEVSAPLATWLLTSIPVSIVFGHCVAGEDEACLSA